MPFAQFKDPKVQLKKEYLEKKYKKGESHISGRDWYNQEAARAVNQAIGRVIRHINDYGLILLVDRRYSDYKSKQERSKWLRDRQLNFRDFTHANQTITDFFDEMKSLNLPIKKKIPLKIFDTSSEMDDSPVLTSKSRRNSSESSTSIKNSNFFITQF